VFKPGDLVTVNDECPLQYFVGRSALVVSNMGMDPTDHSQGWYYRLEFHDGKYHIFTHKELALVSKGEK
jgi:hypothetical protein